MRDDVLEPGHRADVWHAGTHAFYLAEIINHIPWDDSVTEPTSFGPLPADLMKATRDDTDRELAALQLLKMKGYAVELPFQNDPNPPKYKLTDHVRRTDRIIACEGKVVAIIKGVRRLNRYVIEDAGGELFILNENRLELVT